MGIATLSDAFKHRFVFTLVPIAVSLAGFIILLKVHNNVHLEYAALFLAACGTYSAMPIIVCWFNTNREVLNTSNWSWWVDSSFSRRAPEASSGHWLASRVWQ